MFVVKEADRNLGDGGGRGVIFFEGANKLVLIEAAIGRCLALHESTPSILKQ